TCPGYVPGPERRDAPAAPSAGGSRIGHEAAGATGPSAHDARNEGTGGALGRVVRPGPSSSSLKGSSGPEGATDGTATPGQAEDRPSSHPAPKAQIPKRSPSGTFPAPRLAGEQATALGPDPRRAPRRTPGAVAGAVPRTRTPSRPRGSEPDEPTRAAPRAATPPRPLHAGPARLVFGGAASESRPSRAKLVVGGEASAAPPGRAKLVVGGGDPAARPSRAKLIVGGGDAAGADGPAVTTRSETQDLALQPWAMPTMQVTMPENILGPLPDRLRRLGAGTHPQARALPGEVALPRSSILLKAAAQARPIAVEVAGEEEALEPTRTLEPLPSPEASWLAESVNPDERLTPKEILRLVPIWVWVLLAALLLGLLLIFASTEPVDSRVLPEERRMMPGLEARVDPEL